MVINSKTLVGVPQALASPRPPRPVQVAVPEGVKPGQVIQVSV